MNENRNTTLGCHCLVGEKLSEGSVICLQPLHINVDHFFSFLPDHMHFDELDAYLDILFGNAYNITGHTSYVLKLL